MQLYQWHTANDLYPDRGGKSYRLKRLRYRLRSWRHRSLISRYQAAINQSPQLVEMLRDRPNFSYPLVHRFLDKRFNSQERLAAMLDNLHFLTEKLTACGLPPLWQQPISFGEVIPEFEIRLNLNPQQPMEGFWALELRHLPSQELIYLLTFGKVQNALLIAVIQGLNGETAKETVKQLTKKCHGLRPAYLMVETMKMLTATLGFSQLWGIPQRYQNKSRLIQSKRYVVDYDQIFQESRGELHDYWQLPIGIEQKNLDEVASSKRSMYRKRYAMLEALQQQMQMALTNTALNQTA